MAQRLFPRAARALLRRRAGERAVADGALRTGTCPPGPIILVDYAVNFDADNDDASAFERMLRKLLALPGCPAVVLVNTMEIIPPKGKIPANPLP